MSTSRRCVECIHLIVMSLSMLRSDLQSLIRSPHPAPGWKYEIWRSGKEFWVRVVCGVFMMRQVGILVAHLTSGWIRRLERTYSRRGGVEFPELLLKSAHYAWM